MDISAVLKEHSNIVSSMPVLVPDIEKVVSMICDSLGKRSTLLICGNGGSAADAQHFAAELVGRYKKERKALPAIALTTDTSVITAISNDYGFEHVFSRQVEALSAGGDVLFLISTSGNSPNLLEAAKKAKTLGIKIIGLLGKGGGKLKSMCDHAIVIPSDNTPRIQEMHVLVIHMICESVENNIFG
ncbi:D-sedoheptulose 7-phosphate isomerase [Candidatus Micrarchaeota archaeon]|nr:D-sedoheptulose 7-phosphate isomerase [Candidatus Micrarchaeota archaeon]MBU1886431.1 D-sedoheptulose 7-phosphate isomerase [Candidatus Micrarchaeota archaeon]